MINEAGDKVKIQIVDVDQYGRSVAELWTKSGLLQSRMAAAGMAFAYDQYKTAKIALTGMLLSQARKQRST